MAVADSNADIQVSQQALSKLEQLQAAVYKVRFDLPTLLKGLAHIDERELVSVSFNRIVDDAKEFNGDIDELLKIYNECASLIVNAKNDIAAANEANSKLEAPASSSAQSAAASKTPTVPVVGTSNDAGSSSSTNYGHIMADPIQEQNQTAARNSALAAQRSIQNLIGGPGAGAGGLGGPGFSENVHQTNSSGALGGDTDLDGLDDPILLDDASMSFLKF